MGHRQQMNDRQRLNWDSMQYKAKLEVNRGHNYQYWNDSMSSLIDEDGWNFYPFYRNTFGVQEESSESEYLAIEAVNKLRSEGNYARIICGYDRNIQRIKMFSVIYKPRKK